MKPGYVFQTPWNDYKDLLLFTGLRLIDKEIMENYLQRRREIYPSKIRYKSQ